MGVPRELFPCPLPFPEIKGDHHLGELSRSVRSRVRSRQGAQAWANSAVETLNDVYGRPPADGTSLPSSSPPAGLSAAQRAGLDQIRSTYESLPRPECMDTAAAFNALCSGRAGYSDPVPAPRARYHPGAQISLPTHVAAHAQAGSHLRGEALHAWCNWREVLLRTPAERDAALAANGVPEPHTDENLRRRPRNYARFLGQLLDCGIIRLGRFAKPSVFFSCTKKTGAFA